MPYVDREKERQQKQIYYIANREQINERNRQWAKNNYEREKERKQQWRKSNRGYFYQYYKDHREQANEQKRQWKKNNPDKALVINQRRRALKRNATIETITPEQLIALRWSQKDQCIYCERDLKGKGHLDHVTPLSRKGAHSFDNVQWTCEECNLSKGASTDAEYREWLGRKQAA